MNNIDTINPKWKDILKFMLTMSPFQILLPIYIFPLTGSGEFQTACFGLTFIFNGFILYRGFQNKELSKQKENFYKTIVCLSPLLIFCSGSILFFVLQ